MLTIHDNSRQTFKRLLKKACLLSSRAISGTEGTTPEGADEKGLRGRNSFTEESGNWQPDSSVSDIHKLPPYKARPQHWGLDPRKGEVIFLEGQYNKREEPPHTPLSHKAQQQTILWLFGEGTELRHLLSRAHSTLLTHATHLHTWPRGYEFHNSSAELPSGAMKYDRKPTAWTCCTPRTHTSRRAGQAIKESTQHSCLEPRGTYRRARVYSIKPEEDQSRTEPTPELRLDLHKKASASQESLVRFLTSGLMQVPADSLEGLKEENKPLIQTLQLQNTAGKYLSHTLHLSRKTRNQATSKQDKTSSAETKWLLARSLFSLGVVQKYGVMIKPCCYQEFKTANQPGFEFDEAYEPAQLLVTACQPAEQGSTRLSIRPSIRPGGMMDPIQTKSPSWKRKSLPADKAVCSARPDSSHQGHQPGGHEAANFKLEKGNSEQTTNPPKTTKKKKPSQPSQRWFRIKEAQNREACTHAMCCFETQEPGSKMDNARKYHLAWSTIPAAVHENLLPTCIHQMTPTTAHIQPLPQTHTGMHIYAYTPKDTSSFPRAWCGANICMLSGRNTVHWPPGAGCLHIYSGIANNAESKEEKKPDKIKACYQEGQLLPTQEDSRSDWVRREDSKRHLSDTQSAKFHPLSGLVSAKNTFKCSAESDTTGHWGLSEALQASWLRRGMEQTGSDFCPKASVSYRSGCQLGRMSRQQSRRLKPNLIPTPIVLVRIQPYSLHIPGLRQPYINCVTAFHVTSGLNQAVTLIKVLVHIIQNLLPQQKPGKLLSSQTGLESKVTHQDCTRAVPESMDVAMQSSLVWHKKVAAQTMAPVLSHRGKKTRGERETEAERTWGKQRSTQPEGTPRSPDDTCTSPPYLRARALYLAAGSAEKNVPPCTRRSLGKRGESVGSTVVYGYWHTGGRSIALPALKSMRALASNLYVPQPLVHADKGGSWRTSTAPVKEVASMCKKPNYNANKTQTAPCRASKSLESPSIVFGTSNREERIILCLGNRDQGLPDSHRRTCWALTCSTKSLLAATIRIHKNRKALQSETPACEELHVHFTHNTGMAEGGGISTPQLQLLFERKEVSPVHASMPHELHDCEAMFEVNVEPRASELPKHQTTTTIHSEETSPEPASHKTDVCVVPLHSLMLRAPEGSQGVGQHCPLPNSQAPACTNQLPLQSGQQKGKVPIYQIKGFTPWGRNDKAIHKAGPELLQFAYRITKRLRRPQIVTARSPQSLNNNKPRPRGSTGCVSTLMSSFWLAHLNFPEHPLEPLSSHVATSFNNGQALNTTKPPSCSVVNTGSSRPDSKPDESKVYGTKAFLMTSDEGGFLVSLSCDMPHALTPPGFIQSDQRLQQPKALWAHVHAGQGPLSCDRDVAGAVAAGREPAVCDLAAMLNTPPRILFNLPLKNPTYSADSSSRQIHTPKKLPFAPPVTGLTLLTELHQLLAARSTTVTTSKYTSSKDKPCHQHKHSVGQGSTSSRTVYQAMGSSSWQNRPKNLFTRTNALAQS
ncbi:hypothetical protein Anapl_02458 [Anas platyrhynchos]|uniref:Uncharacterized protein n=1 Tax=Anas platyrhynchos TaxID=8839 RepID=R0K1Z2_ANAPL|nr:hypothetical protein Anapl_02458 [Anas platyrhynchos]